MQVDAGEPGHSERQLSECRAGSTLQHMQGADLLGSHGQSLQGRVDILLHRHLDTVYHKGLQ